MKIIIRDRDHDVAFGIAEIIASADIHDIEVERGDIFAKPAQCIVSPANSFGFMDGGIDLVYSRRWPHVQGRLQAAIKTVPFSELGVGSAMLVPTDDEQFPFMIAAPTMRTPSRIPPLNVYLATRAAVAYALVLGQETLLMPGMGTGCGNLPPHFAGAAMLGGIVDGLKGGGGADFPSSLAEARAHEIKVCFGGDLRPGMNGWYTPGMKTAKG